MRRGAVLLLALLAFAALAGCASSTGPTPPPRRFESPIVFPGSSWSYTFSASGDQAYMCHPHTWMLGVVHVVDDLNAASNSTVKIYENADGSMGFTPGEVTVRAGGSVRWTNMGALEHSIMGTEGMHEGE